MKLITFLRTPKYQKFHLEPRYYDPIKEEMQERESRMRQKLKADKLALKEGSDDDLESQSSIAGSFTRRRSSSGSSTSFIQLIIMLLLAGLIFGFIFYGALALYVVVTISCVLLYLKVKRIL